MSIFDKIEESTEFIKERIPVVPKVAIVLGSGLGNLTDKMSIDIRIPYGVIPHFPEATVKGHSGELIFGSLGNTHVAVQSGRYHYYEGYDMKTVTLPIRVFGLMGIEKVIMASAVGGIHEAYEAGDVTVVNDHINLHHENPLNGPNDDRLGPRFPDMVDAYDSELIEICHEVAREKGIVLYDSIYAGLPGPNIETKAEYNFLHTIGATVVGMSTVPEVLVAKHMNLKSCVLTAVTNKCYPISAIRQISHEEVVQVAQKTEEKITTIVIGLLSKLSSN